MFGNYIRITLRHLVKEKYYALINIFGLSIAMACCLILGLYIKNELTYDRHFSNHERIFRVANVFQNYDDGQQRRELATTSPVLGPILASDFPEVEAFVRISPESDVFVQYGDNTRYWDSAFNADDNVFDVFSHEVIYGDPATALTDPSSVAVSKAFAEYYFANANPLGEIISLGNGDSRTITLVFNDLPDNSHLKYDILFSYNQNHLQVAETDIPRWLFGVNTYTYLLMPEGYEARSFESISETFFQQYMERLSQERTNRAWRGWLQPLTSLHLGPDLLADQPTGSRVYLYGFMSVVVFVLLVAVINYTNLATAGYSGRTREIGVRKILGANRFWLAVQFLGESLFLALVSLAIGVFFVELALNQGTLNELLGSVLSLGFIENPGLIVLMLGLGLLLGIVSGAYPAFYLTAVHPAVALMGDHHRQSRSKTVGLREFLMLLQFTVSIGVIACTLLMAMQMRFISNQPLGFNKDNRIVVTVRGDAIEQISLMENELLQHSQVLGVTYATSAMGQRVAVNSTLLETNEGPMRAVQMGHMGIDVDFVDVMGMEIIDGRDFSDEIVTDSGNAVLVNQALVDYMEWEQPVGKSISSTWCTDGMVIGVVENFNFKSLHTLVEPFFMYQSGFSNPDRLGPDRQLVINISGEELAETLTFIEETVTRLNLQQPFEYQFLDSTLDELYLSEERLMYLILLFAGICLVITCLGLLGLAAYTTEQRTKEIGIRKVLGATRWQVIHLLASKTTALACAGALIAALISYPVMNNWLSTFAYRIDLNLLVFPLSLIAVLLVAYGSVSMQSLRISSANPVKALRYE